MFKKSSPNNKITLYLCSRDLVVYNGRIDKLQGVLFLDPDYVEHRKVYGQITLTFRYVAIKLFLVNREIVADMLMGIKRNYTFCHYLMGCKIIIKL